MNPKANTRQGLHVALITKYFGRDIAARAAKDLGNAQRLITEARRRERSDKKARQTRRRSSLGSSSVTA